MQAGQSPRWSAIGNSFYSINILHCKMNTWSTSMYMDDSLALFLADTIVDEWRWFIEYEIPRGLPIAYTSVYIRDHKHDLYYMAWTRAYRHETVSGAVDSGFLLPLVLWTSQNGAKSGTFEMKIANPLYDGESRHVRRCEGHEPNNTYLRPQWKIVSFYKTRLGGR